MTPARQQPAPIVPPPQDLDAEEQLMAALLIHGNPVLRKVQGIIGLADIFKPAHRKIYQAAIRVDARGEDIELVSIAQELSGDHKVFVDMGGASFLTKIVDGAISLNPKSHAWMVKECSVQRDALHLLTRGASEAGQQKGSIVKLLNSMTVGLSEIRDQYLSGQSTKLISALDLVKQNPQMTPLIEGFLNSGEALIIHGPGGGLGKTCCLSSWPFRRQ